MRKKVESIGLRARWKGSNGRQMSDGCGKSTKANPMGRPKVFVEDESERGVLKVWSPTQAGAKPS